VVVVYVEARILSKWHYRQMIIEEDGVYDYVRKRIGASLALCVVVSAILINGILKDVG